MTEYVTGVVERVPIPPASARLAMRVLQIGAIAAVVAVSIRHVFELDRFLVPKELVLHLTAVLAGVLTLRAMSRLALTRADKLLILYLLLSAASAALATNRWAGLRAFAVSVSAVAIFWIARSLREAGLERPVVNALALAVVLACITSLLQTYGVRIDLFSVNRAPGGTLGNRNFVGHAAAFGMPAVLLCAFRARRGLPFALGGMAIVAGTLVLTRSRAAWLAAAGVIAVFLFAIALAPELRRAGRTWRRLALVLVVVAAGVAAALVIPNTLRWRSDNPYLETVQNVAQYDEGSGRGRLLQYERSLKMALYHPLLGVGPGNWPVEYPRYAPPTDPSVNESQPGTTFNPWPSSDWIAYLSERGPVAAALLLIAMISIALSALRQLRRAADWEEALARTGLLATVAGALGAGAFDAVLLLGLPALLVWAVIGALSPNHQNTEIAPSRTIPFAIVLILVVTAALGAVRSAAQLTAMEIYATTGDRGSLVRAAQIDPGNYRVQLRLARGGKKKDRCEHARAAYGLFPNAAASKSVMRGCGE